MNMPDLKREARKYVDQLLAKTSDPEFWKRSQTEGLARLDEVAGAVMERAMTRAWELAGAEIDRALGRRRGMFPLIDAVKELVATADRLEQRALEEREKYERLRAGFTIEGKTPSWARCLECEHRWIGLYLPMPVQRAADVMLSTRCPVCGGKASEIVSCSGPNQPVVETPATAEASG
jgi:hypothetical protein